MTERKKTDEVVVIAGGSGFIGLELEQALSKKGYKVVILSRSSSKPDSLMLSESTEWLEWDAESTGEWIGALEGARAVINLVGRSVDCIHNEVNKREILESRLKSVAALAEAIEKCRRPPELWIQASSLAVYGSPGERICDESADHGDDFSVRVCQEWEDALLSRDLGDIRKVVLRIGIVLASHGGALQKLSRLTRCFLGGTVGSGRQYISWIHLEDQIEMFLWALEKTDVSGIYNSTGPEPVSNREFMRELRRALGRPWSPPAPAWAVRLGARWILRTDADLALEGRRCIPGRFIEAGFEFKFRDLRSALENIFSE